MKQVTITFTTTISFCVDESAMVRDETIDHLSTLLQNEISPLFVGESIALCTLSVDPNVDYSEFLLR